MSQKNVHIWYRDFKEVRERVAPDDHRFQLMTKTIKEMVLGIRRLRIRELVNTVEISFGSVQTILKDHLGLRSFKSHLAPKSRRSLLPIQIIEECRNAMYMNEFSGISFAQMNI